MFRIIIAVFLGLVTIKSTAQLSALEDQFVFVKGSNDTIPVFGAGLFEDEGDSIPEYLVNELKDFYISKTCVTVGDYKMFCSKTEKSMPEPPKWGWTDDTKPMVNINYKDALDYCTWLSDSLQIKVRLPHQEEWVYAANNGGFVDPINFDSIPNNIKKLAVFKNSSATNIQLCVTCKEPNKIGIYNMLGNVWEWADGWFYNTDAEEPEINEELHMVVGGSYLSPKRDMYLNKALMIPESTRKKDIGFRVAISLEDYLKAKLIVKLNNYLNDLAIDKNEMQFTYKGILCSDTLVSWDAFIKLSVDYELRKIVIDYKTPNEEFKTAEVLYPENKEKEIAKFHTYFLVISDYFLPKE
ncbi:hypothetical protein NBRC110019_27150 [Neptunitalea chrysea]|uniref:Sulfatase-modifying factor enzyme-like domain-containing protein n=1 Tax=Neptunitalea chrysea TaxID=1647581 RepID=A0A9W6EVD1_9FLAO|nr:SUMF1/EgtB/PvdO family nonheme iron enzyme [Neptunitalea chrysea]GLB53674.1 hypothetical protein NBRC110019_27150 [Neptunitalea chrysea]